MYHEYVLLTIAALSCYLLTYFQRRTPLPPGPKPRFILGNALDLTSKELWLRVSGWAQKFGGICHLQIFGQHIIFLNNADAAFELLDKRGSIYSSKPRLVMVGEMCGCAEMIPFTPYGDTFRRRRRLMQQTLGPRSIPNYHEYLQVETKRVIHSILEDPENYIRHVRRYAGGLTLSAIYGYNVTSNNDKYLMLAEECMDLFANEIVTGAGVWPVDVFNFLRFIPSWMPGAGFKRKAVIWKKKMEEFVEFPFAEAKANMAAGTIHPSFCRSHLDSDTKLTQNQEIDLKWTANSMYSASADTTVSTVSHLILAMMYFPSEFEKVRKEIESVVGVDRLPTFKDRESLPYLECIFKETLRWGCPIPLNLPHLLEEDDEYLGYTIPKDTIVIANIWNMVRDESIYPEADKFKPDRFMDSNKDPKRIDPRNYIFGFGRRRCPGADLVNSSIWLLMATMISTIEISKPTNSDGLTFEPDIKFNNMFFRTPDAFQFNVKSRSKLHSIS